MSTLYLFQAENKVVTSHLFPLFLEGEILLLDNYMLTYALKSNYN